MRLRFCLKLSTERKAAYERPGYLSSSKLAEELSARLLNGPTQIILRTAGEEKVATLQDLREALLPLGLDITTRDALNWDVKYPGLARDVTRICELNQQLEALQAERAGLLEPPVPIDKKEAAE